LKDFHKYAPHTIFKKIDPDFGAITIGAEVTRLGAEVYDHFLRIVDIAAYMVQT
jgi:hypothetical protein